MADAAGRSARIEALEASVRQFGARDPAGAAIRALFETIWKVDKQGLHDQLPSDLDFLQSNIDHFRRNDTNKSCPLRSAVYSMVEATKCMLANLKEKQTAPSAAPPVQNPITLSQNAPAEEVKVLEYSPESMVLPRPPVSTTQKPVSVSNAAAAEEVGEDMSESLILPRPPGSTQALDQGLFLEDAAGMEMPKDEPLDPFPNYLPGPSTVKSEQELNYLDDDTSDSLPQFDNGVYGNQSATQKGQVGQDSAESMILPRPPVTTQLPRRSRYRVPAAPAAAVAAVPPSKLLVTHTGSIIAVPPEAVVQDAEAPSVGDLLRKGMNLRRKRKGPLTRPTRHKMKVYTCTVCSREFATAEFLDNHMLDHTGEHPVKCPKCLRTFKRRANLDVHLAQQHNVQKPMQLSLSWDAKDKEANQTV